MNLTYKVTLPGQNDKTYSDVYSVDFREDGAVALNFTRDTPLAIFPAGTWKSVELVKDEEKQKPKMSDLKLHKVQRNGISVWLQYGDPSNAQ